MKIFLYSIIKTIGPLLLIKGNGKVEEGIHSERGRKE
jgi:hypothetical protein